MPPHRSFSNRPTWDQLERYLAGTLSHEEQMWVETRLLESDNALLVIDTYRRAVQNLAPRPDRNAVETALQDLHGRLAQLRDVANTSGPSQVKTRAGQ